MTPLAAALERHDGAVAARAQLFSTLHALVGSPPDDLALPHWFELLALVLDEAPQLIVELGRGWGNSTCVFVEGAHAVGARVVSIGNDGDNAWRNRTQPRIEPVVGESWFEPLTVLEQDICETDFAPLTASAQAVFVFWDAHGGDVARAVLERLLPALPSRNLVVVHDIADTRVDDFDYAYVAGPLGSMFEEVEPLWEYLRVRDIEFTADFGVRFRAR
jgi:cephalosporin hydroxylase